MKIEVDFPVITTGLAPRNKGHKPVVGRKTITVDVPEYSDAEAPAVMMTTFRRNSGPEKEVLRYKGVGEKLYRPSDIAVPRDGRVRHMFSFDYIPQVEDVHGSLNEKIGVLLSQLRDQHKTALPSAIIPSSLGQYRLDNDRVGREGRYVELPMLSELGLKEFDEQAVGAQTAAFSEHMARFIVAGGKMHISTGEPFYLCSFIGENAPATLTVKESELSGKIGDDVGSDYGVACFRADESLEDMSDEIERLVKLSEHPRQVPGDTAHRIHVFDPAFVMFDAAAANMRLAAREAIDGFVADTARKMSPFSRHVLAQTLMSLPVEVFNAYRSLELALANDDYDAIANILPQFGRFQPGAGDGSGFVRSEAMIIDVVDRWDNRTVGALTLQPRTKERTPK
jgi:hypothetical protein